MVTFSRKDLIYSQNCKLDRIYKDINFFIWLGWVMVTIVSIVTMYFFSIMIGIWLEAVVVFGFSIYYLIMSFVRERMNMGYYQKAISIEVVCFADGIALKELAKEEQTDYLVSYDQISKIVEFKKYFVIILKDEGRITLPNIEQAAELKGELKNNLRNHYFVYES